MADPDYTAELIRRVCQELADLLAVKNRADADSVLAPVPIFSKTDLVEQINVLIDYKVARIARGLDAEEDTELNLLGYLVLKRVALLRETELNAVEQSISKALR